MNYKIFNLEVDNEVIEYLSILPDSLKNRFFIEELLQFDIIGTKYCFVLQEDENIGIYHFIKTKINDLEYNFSQEYYDIQCEYAYNGPTFLKKDDKKFISKFRSIFNNYCKDNNIIAEFIRFNSLEKNHINLSDIELLKINQNLIIDLSLDDVMMESYEHSARKNVKKAIKSNLKSEIKYSKDISENDISAFYEIYIKTMDRNKANEEYYYSKEYFYNFRKTMPENSFYIFIYKDSKLISVELVLFSRNIAYSFLGGTLSEFFEFRPNDFLKHCVINELRNKKIEYFNLGGGATSNDGIFKYKKSFAKNGVYDFYIGKKIHNENIYLEVVDLWKSKKETEVINKYKNYLLKYHF